MALLASVPEMPFPGLESSTSSAAALQQYETASGMRKESAWDLATKASGDRSTPGQEEAGAAGRTHIWCQSQDLGSRFKIIKTIIAIVVLRRSVCIDSHSPRANGRGAVGFGPDCASLHPMHAEQTPRGAVSVVIEAPPKRKYCTPMEVRDRKGSNDSLKMGFEKYLEKGKIKKRKRTKGQPPLASKQDAPEADILEEVDRAISADDNTQTSGKRHTSNPPAGLTSLPELIKWIAQRCTNPHYVRCLYGDQDIVHEIFDEAQGNGECKFISNEETQSS